MAESFSNNLISNTIFHLLNFERYPGFQTALKEAAVNNNFQVVLYSEDFNRIFAVETLHRASPEDVARARVSQNIGDNIKSITVGFGDDMSTFWRPVSIGGVHYYLLLVDNDNNFSQDDLSKLSEIIELAMGMWNYAPERDLTAEFISALRRGNTSRAMLLADELELDPTQFIGVYYIPSHDRDSAMKILADYETRWGAESLKQPDRDEIAGVILKSGNPAAWSSENFAVLAEELRNIGVKCSYCFTAACGVDDLCSAFRTIVETENCVPLIFPQKSGFSKYEMALAANCIYLCMNGSGLRNTYTQLLRPLSDSSDLKSRQLLETLEAFILDAGGSTAATAKILGIHANTVQYRIKHIRELLNTDITDNTVIPGLTVALALRRIDKEVRSI